ncbi:hypothetical protein IAU60_004481 [Kwoniella sp. DSM 27419]
MDPNYVQSTAYLYNYSYPKTSQVPSSDWQHPGWQQMGQSGQLTVDYGCAAGATEATVDQQLVSGYDGLLSGQDTLAYDMHCGTPTPGYGDYPTPRASLMNPTESDMEHTSTDVAVDASVAEFETWCNQFSGYDWTTGYDARIAILHVLEKWRNAIHDEYERSRAGEDCSAVFFKWQLASRSSWGIDDPAVIQAIQTNQRVVRDWLDLQANFEYTLVNAEEVARQEAEWISSHDLQPARSKHKRDPA